MAYKEIEGDEIINFFKFAQLGQSIEGRFLGTRTNVPGDYGPQTLHDIENADGKFAVRGNPDLNSKLAKVKAGASVRVTYHADKDLGGINRDGTPKNPMKVFRVEMDDGKQAAAPF